MKIRQSLLLMFAAFILCAGVVSVNAQKTAPYKITAVRLVPYNQQTGKFEDEIKPKDERAFFNEIALGMFVVVEVSGATGTFEAGRTVQITVTEGKKLKAKKSEQIGLISDGKFYIPMYLDSAFCSDVTVTAKILGQATASTITRKASFLCGE
jgi:hypothetical protein